MRIRRKFLQLTKWTYPYGSEEFLEIYLPSGVKKDEHDNYYIVIGDNAPTTMFACHLDTSCSKHEKVTHRQSSQFIRTNGKTILGADDKAGMVLVLYMIEKKIPGLYYFFIGEEVGCVGSGDLAKTWKKNDFSKTVNKIVSFDRRGTDSIITHQFYGRCCSDEFAKELSKRLSDTKLVSMKPDSTGVMTDSAKFMGIVPECTNISVGYYKEHTHDEHQDIEFLQNLCRAVTMIDWDSLPVKRDPSVEDDYGYYYGYGKYHQNSNKPSTTSTTSKTPYVNDSWEESGDSDGITVYEYEFSETNFAYIKCDENGSKRMLVSKTHIEYEKKLIYSWMFTQNMVDVKDMSGIYWNGNSLYVYRKNGQQEFVGNRSTVMELVTELKSIPKKELSDKPSGRRAVKVINKKEDNKDDVWDGAFSRKSLL
jgi:hypothetical protein